MPVPAPLEASDISQIGNSDESRPRSSSRHISNLALLGTRRISLQHLSLIRGETPAKQEDCAKDQLCRNTHFEKECYRKGKQVLSSR